MTIDEAIKHIEEVAEKYKRHLKIYENMDDDLFRVEKNECKNCAKEHRQLAGWLKELKQLREQTRWIPCSERLPEDYEDVLVWLEYFRYGDYNRLYQTHGIGDYSSEYDSWMINHESGWSKLRVFAWMPLPEPYRGERTEE